MGAVAVVWLTVVAGSGAAVPLCTPRTSRRISNAATTLVAFATKELTERELFIIPRGLGIPEARDDAFKELRDGSARRQGRSFGQRRGGLAHFMGDLVSRYDDGVSLYTMLAESFWSGVGDKTPGSSSGR